MAPGPARAPAPSHLRAGPFPGASGAAVVPARAWVPAATPAPASPAGAAHPEPGPRAPPFHRTHGTRERPPAALRPLPGWGRAFSRWRGVRASRNGPGPGWAQAGGGEGSARNPGWGRRAGPAGVLGGGPRAPALALRQTDTRPSPRQGSPGEAPPGAWRVPDLPFTPRLSDCETRTPREKKTPQTVRIWYADVRLRGGARPPAADPGARPDSSGTRRWGGRARHLAAPGPSAAHSGALGTRRRATRSLRRLRPAGGREEVDAWGQGPWDFGLVESTVPRSPKCLRKALQLFAE